MWIWCGLLQVLMIQCGIFKCILVYKCTKDCIFPFKALFGSGLFLCALKLCLWSCLEMFLVFLNLLLKARTSNSAHEEDKDILDKKNSLKRICMTHDDLELMEQMVRGSLCNKFVTMREVFVMVQEWVGVSERCTIWS